MDAKWLKTNPEYVKVNIFQPKCSIPIFLLILRFGGTLFVGWGSRIFICLSLPFPVKVSVLYCNASIWWGIWKCLQKKKNSLTGQERYIALQSTELCLKGSRQSKNNHNDHPLHLTSCELLFQHYYDISKTDHMLRSQFSTNVLGQKSSPHLCQCWLHWWENGRLNNANCCWCLIIFLKDTYNGDKGPSFQNSIFCHWRGEDSGYNASILCGHFLSLYFQRALWALQAPQLNQNFFEHYGL